MKLRAQSIPIAIGLVIAALAAVPASAVTVSYQTSGYFSPSQSYITFGCYSCSKDGLTAYSSSDWVEPGVPANDKLGWFNVVNGTHRITSPINFSLTVTETEPTNGSNTFTGSLSGSIRSGNGGGLLLHFNQVAVTIGTETYELTGTNPFSINNHGPTELDAEIFTTSNAPEPSLYMLTGSGFVGLLVMAIRRRKQTV
ncbi:MAG: hypothetical protein JO270_01130 [Acidobacteriaceae bacterium]|nr:hypothetical protein [Acidobacteriaceae bacterium]MBV8570263.1 hypothetical protein [Acidobacteriaceae bacterium]